MLALTENMIVCKCGELVEVPIGPDVRCSTCGIRWARMLIEKGKVLLMKKNESPNENGESK